jgi:MFS family permease
VRSFIKTQFSLSPATEEVVVSAVLVGAVIGAVIGGALTDRFGRGGLIIVAGIIFTVSAIGTALARGLCRKSRVTAAKENIFGDKADETKSPTLGYADR